MEPLQRHQAPHQSVSQWEVTLLIKAINPEAPQRHRDCVGGNTFNVRVIGRHGMTPKNRFFLCQNLFFGLEAVSPNEGVPENYNTRLCDEYFPDKYNKDKE